MVFCLTIATTQAFLFKRGYVFTHPYFRKGGRGGGGFENIWIATMLSYKVGELKRGTKKIYLSSY